MFRKGTKKEVELNSQPNELPKAFKDRFENIEEDIKEVEEAVNEESLDEQIEDIQERIDKIQPSKRIKENLWELVEIPARTVARNKLTGKMIELTQENFINILNGN